MDYILRTPKCESCKHAWQKEFINGLWGCKFVEPKAFTGTTSERCDDYIHENTDGDVHSSSTVP